MSEELTAAHAREIILEQEIDRLKSALKVARGALEHQRRRDHEYKEWCDGCSSYTKALALIDGAEGKGEK